MYSEKKSETGEVSFSCARVPLGMFICLRRCASGLTQKEVAQEIKDITKCNRACSKARISKIERGITYPSDAFLSLLSSILDVPYCELKRHDCRMPHEELEKLMQRNTEFGHAMQYAVSVINKNDLTPDEFAEIIHAYEKANQDDRRNER